MQLGAPPEAAGGLKVDATSEYMSTSPDPTVSYSGSGGFPRDVVVLLCCSSLKYERKIKFHRIQQILTHFSNDSHHHHHHQKWPLMAEFQVNCNIEQRLNMTRLMSHFVLFQPHQSSRQHCAVFTGSLLPVLLSCTNYQVVCNQLVSASDDKTTKQRRRPSCFFELVCSHGWEFRPPRIITHTINVAICCQ